MICGYKQGDVERTQGWDGRPTFKGMDVFSSSDELAVLLHIQLAGFLGLWRTMEDSLRVPHSARIPTGRRLATTHLNNGSRVLRSDKLDIASGVSSKERHVGWTRVNLGIPPDRRMQQLVDNDEASIQRLGVLSDIDENIP